MYKVLYGGKNKYQSCSNVDAVIVSFYILL